MKRLIFSAVVAIMALGATAAHPNPMEVILPTPNQIVVGDGGALNITGGGVKLVSENADAVTDYFSQEIANRFDFVSNKGRKVAITVDSTLSLAPEAYRLSVTKKGVVITSATESGAFYGVQSLLQLMRAGFVDGSAVIGFVEITDAPRFGWRAMMLDEARYFFGVEYVKNLLDVMAELKMNVLHWHLTDDAGWRIEIKQYPLLTEIGSKRKDTEIGTWGSGKTSGEPHEGFYTQEQIKDIVKYAKERNIKVVPEIEMPGHACASVAAYPWLGCRNEKIEVPVKFGKHYYTYDVINPEVIEFLHNVLVEVIDIFDTDVVHIGGDEVRFDQWEEDKDMQAYFAEKGFNSYMDIQIEFTNNMSKFIESKGCRMMGWNEILGKDVHSGDNIKFAEISTSIAPNVIVQFWVGSKDHLAEAAQKGYQIVNSHSQYTYLDYNYKSIPLSRAYGFDPIPEGLAPEYHSNIFGLGCQMWTEWTPDVVSLNRQIFPRIAAYAEIGWTDAGRKDFGGFVERLKPILGVWESERGIVAFPCEELK